MILNNNRKKIMFVSGTRADYGKIKSLMTKIKTANDFELLIFVTGMHMLAKYGLTYTEIEKDGFERLYKYINQNSNSKMDIALSNTILGMSNYVQENKPDLIVIHGDRIEALAGAIVGALNNIRVAHIEGGELSGTIDESIRHAITKFSHYHFVSNSDAKKRVIQLGEKETDIFVIGSPDIDIMFSDNLPTLNEVQNRYEIKYENYGIALYHPVTTEIQTIERNINEFTKGLLESKRNFVIISPNNDHGSNLIEHAYEQIRNNTKFRIFPSLRFEYFLTLLKNADFIIGNSSSGIREAHIYGIPAINVGSRQNGRVEKDIREHIIDVSEKSFDIINAIKMTDRLKIEAKEYFGNGKSAEKFLEIISSVKFWSIEFQKKFYDLN